ncbi:MAG: elongation factor P [Candidatus Omnitrophica bacterium CG1_02_49_10]|nr:MAG: elongation factor P [Candidatus Omnitrophica bacterium CG1_02_49_10]
MLSTNQFKSGKTIEIDAAIYSIIDFHHVKPGKGGAFVKTKLRNIKTGAVIDRTFRSGEKFDEAYIEQKQIQFLYAEGDMYHFMDDQTFEQLMVPKETLGEAVYFVKESDTIVASLHNNLIIGITLPPSVNLKVAHTEPGIKGDTSKMALKPATLETGLVIQVPLFIDEGNIIKVDTRTKEYTSRV